MSRQDAAMKKETAADGICLYTFTDYEERHANTITVIVHSQEKQALVIDPSYPEFAERLKIDLQEQGITAEKIVISHYHPDHVSGCAALPQCEIHASEFYGYNYDNCQIWEPNFTYLRPTQLIRDGDSLTFGDFDLKFHHAPGHSKCSLMTEITDKILHIGDLIMICWDRKNSLPYISDGGNFEDHIKSLNHIKELDPDAIVVPHGEFIDNKTRLHALVDDRLYYLEKVLDSKGSLPLEQCVKNDISWYDHLEFHDTNIIHFL